MGGKGPVADLILQLLAEHAESGAAVEDVDAVAEAHFDAGGIASITHILGFLGLRRTAHTPELDPHRLVTAPGPDCLVFLGIFRRWAASVNCRVGSQPTISLSS